MTAMQRPQAMRTRSLPGAWWSGAGAVAVAVILVQLLWRGSVMMRGYFTQDDFLILSSSVTRDPDVVPWLQPFSGGLSPLGHALAGVQTSTRPLDWFVVGAVAVVVQAATAVLLWLVLSRLLGESWLRVVLLGLACLSPLTIWATASWAAVVTTLPPALLLVAAVWFVLLRLQDGRRWGTGVALACVAAAMLFSDRAVLLPIVLGGLVLAHRDARGARARVVDTVRELPGLWLGLAGLGACLLTVRVQALPGSLDVPRDPDVVSEAVRLFFRQVLPGLLGGPWTGEATTHSVHYEVLWPFALAVVITGLLVGFGLREAGSRFRWAMGALVVYLVVSLTLLSASAGDSLVVALGTVPRHASDLVPALVLLMAAGLSGGVRTPGVIQGGFEGRLSARSARGVTAVAALSLAAGASVATAQVMIPDLLNEDDRAYVDNLRAGLAADTQVVLVDGAVPEGVMSGWFEDEARVSTVVGALPERPLFDLPSSTLRMVDEDGHLRQVALAGALRMRDSEQPDCGYPINHVPSAIPLTGPVSGDQHVMRIGYYTDTSTYAVLELPESVARFPVHAGLHEIEVVVDEPFTEVVMSLEDVATTVCVAALHVGRPVPGQ